MGLPPLATKRSAMSTRSVSVTFLVLDVDPGLLGLEDEEPTTLPSRRTSWLPPGGAVSTS